MASPKKRRNESPPLKPAALTEFFPRGSSVLIGLSGGADSIALTHLLWELATGHGLSLSACHINHGLRGDASEADQDFCERFCDRLEIPFITVNMDIAGLASSLKLGLEEAGRLARHFVFNQLAEEDEFDLVALGHHADDQVETVLFRLFRGTGPDGLAGMRPRSGRVVRPLLKFSREEILQYLEKNHLEYREDSSNTDESFSRNYIRHTLLPAIEERFPAAPKSIRRLADLCADESAFLDSVVEKKFKKLSRISPGGAVIVDKSALSRQELWLQRRLFRHCLSALTGGLSDVSYATIEALVKLVKSKSGGRSLPHNVFVKIDRDMMIFAAGRGARIQKKSISPGKKLALPEIFSLLETRYISPADVVRARQKRGWRAHIDGAKIRGELTVRSGRPGDRFRPLGMRGTKTLGDFFTDLKVPQPLRGEVPIVCDDEGIVWVAGYQISERVKLDKRLSAKSKPLELEIVRRKRKAT